MVEVGTAVKGGRPSAVRYAAYVYVESRGSMVVRVGRGRGLTQAGLCTVTVRAHGVALGVASG